MFKRAAVYAFFDKDGIVDPYVEYFLKDFSKNVDKLVVVCNGYINDMGIKALNLYATDVLVRENCGFDIGAYQFGMEYIGWNKLAEYDELVVLNDTIMGPVYPFSIMFSEMEGRKLDFWGITRHYYKDVNPYQCVYGCIPEHIQSYFMVFRKQLLKTNIFLDYWKNMPIMKTYADAVGKHELYFTKYFGDLGFKWDTYVETDDLEERNAQPIIMYATELIKNRKCPIFKRRLFFQDYDRLLEESVGQSPLETYRFLDEETDYDMNMVMTNLLRVCNQEDVAKCLHFNYVLSTTECNSNWENKVRTTKIALVMHLHYMDLLESNLYYVKQMPIEADIYLITNEEWKKKIIREKVQDFLFHHIEVRLVKNRGRDVGGFLIGARDIVDEYDYICFAHDKKSLQLKPQSQGESFAYHCMKNLLYNKKYIYNILDTFEKNSRLGILTPTGPNHGDYFSTVGNEWGDNFIIAKRLAEEMNIHVKLDANKDSQFTLGDCFWFRSEALKIMFKRNWKYEDFPEEPIGEDASILHAIERLYSLAAQEAGYYTGHVFSDEYARIELTNIRHELRRYNQVLCRQGIKRSDVALNQYIDELRLNISGIYQSTSWRITKPIRMILDRLRN